MKEDAKPVVFGLLAWLCFALAFGVGGWFRNASAPAVAATVWTLTALTLLASRIRVVRDCIALVDPRWLIALHLTRFVGIYFLILGSRRHLPEGFAKPAGIGDIAIAVGAVALLFALGRDGAAPSAAIPAPSAAARRPYHMRLLGAWNLLGLIDIVFVAFSALRFGLKDWQAMAALRELPLSLLPTFIVPLIIVSHILIFVRLKVDAASSRVVK